MKFQVTKCPSKIPSMTTDSSENIFAYHKVFLTNKSDVLLINKGKDENTGKALAAFHSYGKPEWQILIKFSQDRAENRSPQRSNEI